METLFGTICTTKEGEACLKVAQVEVSAPPCAPPPHSAQDGYFVCTGPLLPACGRQGRLGAPGHPQWTVHVK